MLWQDKSQICGIGLYDAERGAWVMKYDGAENTDIEPVKGGLSDSFKRAAVLWGIGRYLYDMASIWVEIEPSGKSSQIKNSEYDRLRGHYDKSVAALFDDAPAPKALPRCLTMPLRRKRRARITPNKRRLKLQAMITS